MIPVIGAGLGLLAALPDLWDGVARIFGRQTPSGVKAAGELARDVGRILAGGQATPEQQEKLAALMLPHQERIREMTLAAERDFDSQLTARHQADTASDSRLSKNIRPLCLLFLTLAVTLGVWLPDSCVSADRFKALTEMAVWVYGYYFVGRSAFDKGNVKLDWSRP
ncbi:MAG: hypothetical protein AB1916_07430 [Thermodesulfobacteriota bacterium]